jgi:hypothetical protein
VESLASVEPYPELNAAERGVHCWDCSARW